MRYSQVFDNAKQLNNFLPLNDEFESLNNDIGKDIDDSGQEKIFNQTSQYDEESKILQLKNNTIPGGLLPLEKSFDINDLAKKPSIQLTRSEVEHFNIGIEENPNIVNISKSLCLKEKQR